ncbi:MAG: response regulator transcription factor [Myxococcales bacterium]|nr:response regulator transcription factor [Myxococcales bacterium]
MERILLVEDDLRLGQMVQEYLTSNGFYVTHVSTAREGKRLGKISQFDLIVLDLMLPDGDGLDVCRDIRGTSNVPIVMLTARGDDTDRIVGLELGADDYLPKPFNPRELLARIRAVLRRKHATPNSDILRIGGLELDRAAREVRRNGEVIRLTSHQFDLLLALAERAGRVLSRDQLMEIVRDHPLDAYDRSIDVHISRIRQAIEDDPRNPRWILTLRGSGYMFVAPHQTESTL